MKHARVVYKGRQYDAVEVDDGLQLDDGEYVNEHAVLWLPPVEPRTIFAVGLNYSDHAAEIDSRAPQKPLIFLKGPDACSGHRTETRRPSGVENMHYECELAVVIGREGRAIARARAYDHVAGYTVANDYAVRDYLENYYRPNLRVKSRDACTPIGPWLVDAADIADPHNLALSTHVNGKLTQSGTTRDMIFTIPFLIEYLSEFMTLSPGDIILTGTPKGVCDCRPGDEVVTEIEGIGQLVNTIVADNEIAASSIGDAA